MNNSTCFFKWYATIMFCSILSFAQIMQSQTFERIENFAGLDLSEENNGVAIADYDGDGDLDLFVVAKAVDEAGVAKSHSRLFSNNDDGTFQDVTNSSGLVDLFPSSETVDYYSGLSGAKHGAFWGDYDNDGFPDLFLTNTYKIQLFHNEGNGTFLEVTEAAGFQKYSQCLNTGATWFDYNNDGFLDIYITDWATLCEGNRLYTNNGDGTFTNTSNIFTGVVNKHAYESVPFDFNHDGWLDLYVANDTEPNDLFINENGTGFREQAGVYNLNRSEEDMGIAIGDYNNDGFFDMYITAIAENALYTNVSNSEYNDLAQSQGVFNTGWGWNTVFADFDLDGDEDLFVVNGFESGGWSSESNVYFENLHANGESRFIDQSGSSNLGAVTISTSAGIFDYDNDGDLDIFVTNADRPSYFYENKTTDFTYPNPEVNWFKVALQGTVSNRDAIGTTLTLITNQGVFHRYYSGKGFLSQSLNAVHFGLGTATEIQSLKIIWPSGLVEDYYNLSVNTSIKVQEGVGLGISIVEPSIKSYGCTDVNSCNYNPNAIINSGGCLYLEKQAIVGETNSVRLDNEFYTYALQPDETAFWTVEGGELLEGQGENIIKVKWGEGTTGKITVVAQNDVCSSQLAELNITLRDATIALLPEKEHSVARLWNEALLEAIRKDYARPTVHARNLFHTSVAMYDAWAVYNETATTYLIGKEVHGFRNSFGEFVTTENLETAINKTISYAAYRLLVYRFKNSPNLAETMGVFNDLMNSLRYDISETSIDYSTGDPIALGNYIADVVINYGHHDRANEINKYENTYYTPVNPALILNNPEQSEALIDPNRWQPLSFNTFIDQSGNLIEGSTPGFLSPEWGNVKPFSLDTDEKESYQRSGNTYNVYHDPGAPPYLSANEITASSEAYKWGFSLVSEWSAHLTPYDGVLWDISPKSIGNINREQYPQHYSDYSDFYKVKGGDIGTGHSINPFTQAPYEEQFVPRGDYTRVLAEFWADGPDSETPPGHWFTLLNYVSDHNQFEKRFHGEGQLLSDLEWDIKSYFIMGGAMHDSAISAWSIKGWYDYIRPISAIRYMCEAGQSSDPSKSNYNISGIPLKPGYVELVEMGDPLAGDNNEHVGKVKLYAWKGHDYIEDVTVDQAGVDWILAEKWWPYQRPSFVTPPFAGYVSGHSTYSRAAAEVMTLLTGDAFFPGGYGEFIAEKDKFLVFEEGPSVDVKLQWATYRDASDQCSLSRIWGGIHPPADDIPGRLIGETIGQNAYHFGIAYFTEQEGNVLLTNDVLIYPNPTTDELTIHMGAMDGIKRIKVYDLVGKLVFEKETLQYETKIHINDWSKGMYLIHISNKNSALNKRIIKQ